MVAAIVLIVVIAIPLTPQAIMQISEADEPELGIDGTSVVFSCTYNVTSTLSYPIEDLSLSLHLVDRVNGSDVRIWEADGISVPAGGGTEVRVEVSVFAPTLYLVLGDLLSREGSVVPLEVRASCGYAMGLVGLTVSGTLSVPMADSGGTVGWDTVDTPDSTVVEVSGLADWVPAPEADVVIAGGDATVRLMAERSGGSYRIAVSADGDLDSAVSALLDADSISVTSLDGTVSSGDWRIPLLLEALRHVRGSP